ncbi:MAG: hypothetical protein AABM33_15215 [Pseudomonadota bacterium]
MKLPLEPVGTCLADTMLDKFFDSQASSSFREVYQRITGDQRITGRLKNCDRTAMREALDSGSWPSVLSAAVNRQMVVDYRGPGWDAWRRLVTIKRGVTNFRTQQAVRIGGYGDLQNVAEGDPYPSLESPTEETGSYAVTKRGGTETITLEMIKNDDIQAIRGVPKRLAQAAQRTVARFALEFLRTNPVIYDGVALFHATHGNLGNAALSASSLHAGRVALMRQAEPGSGEKLGTQPRCLWVPLDLEESAANLFRRGTNQDKTFVQNMPVEVIPVWYWENTNNWCLSADPDLLPSIELAFLDGNDEPQIILQGLPTGGSLFSNDQITMKLRHIYGGTVINYRGLYKSIV